MLILTLQAIALVLAIGLTYVALFLYPGERREMRNKLEDWWYAVALGGDSAIARHVKYQRYVSLIARRPLDAIVSSWFTSAWHAFLITVGIIEIVAAQVGWVRILGVVSIVVAFLPLAHKKLATPVLISVYVVATVSLLVPGVILLAHGTWGWWAAAGALMLTGGIYYVVLLSLRSFLSALVDRGAHVIVRALTWMVFASCALYFPHFEDEYFSLGTLIENAGAPMAFGVRWWFALQPAVAVTYFAAWPLYLMVVVVVGFLLHKAFWGLTARFLHLLWENEALANKRVLVSCAGVLFIAGGWRWVSVTIQRFL